LGTISLRGWPALHAAAGTNTPKVRQWEVQELVNTAWASAKPGFHEQPPTAGTPANAARQPHRHTPRDPSNTSWALATLNVVGRPLLQLTCLERCRKPGEGDAQATSNAARGSRTCLVLGQASMAAASDQAMPGLHGPDEQGCATTAFAFGTPQLWRYEPLTSAPAARGITVTNSAENSGEAAPRHAPQHRHLLDTLGFLVAKNSHAW
ncbi:unnamed protein product, partial [Polarella glacialis]